MQSPARALLAKAREEVLQSAVVQAQSGAVLRSHVSNVFPFMIGLAVTVGMSDNESMGESLAHPAVTQARACRRVIGSSRG